MNHNIFPNNLNLTIIIFIVDNIGIFSSYLSKSIDKYIYKVYSLIINIFTKLYRTDPVDRRCQISNVDHRHIESWFLIRLSHLN